MLAPVNLIFTSSSFPLWMVTHLVLRGSLKPPPTRCRLVSGCLPLASSAELMVPRSLAKQANQHFSPPLTYTTSPSSQFLPLPPTSTPPTSNSSRSSAQALQLYPTPLSPPLSKSATPTTSSSPPTTCTSSRALRMLISFLTLGARQRGKRGLQRGTRMRRRRMYRKR